MPTLHRTIEAAANEAAELLDRCRQRRVFVVRSERIYDNHTKPGFEALCHFEIPVLDKCKIVATVTTHKLHHHAIFMRS